MNNLNKILNIDITTESKLFKKGTILQESGRIPKHVIYVKKGLLRSYTIDENGKEHIFMFAPEGWVIADIDSLEFEQTTELFIDCIEDSEVIVLTKECLKLNLTSTEKILEQVKLLSKRIGVMQKRIIMLMSATATKRYQYFLDTYPNLPNRVPQKMIASYLGITPEALSKLRSKLARS